MFLIVLSQLALADTITLDTGVAIEGDLARYEFGGDCQISVTEGDLGGVIVIVPCRRVASFVRTELQEPEVIGRVEPPAPPAVAAAPPVPAPVVAPPVVAAAPPVPAPVELVAAPVVPPAPVEPQVVADAPYAGEPVYEAPVEAPIVLAVPAPPPVAAAPEPTALERLGLSEDTEPFLPPSDWQAPAMGSIDPEEEEEDEDATPAPPAAASRAVSF